MPVILNAPRKIALLPYAPQKGEEGEAASLDGKLGRERRLAVGQRRSPLALRQGGSGKMHLSWGTAVPKRDEETRNPEEGEAKAATRVGQRSSSAAQRARSPEVGGGKVRGAGEQN